MHITFAGQKRKKKLEKNAKRIPEHSLLVSVYIRHSRLKNATRFFGAVIILVPLDTESKKQEKIRIHRIDNRVSPECLSNKQMSFVKSFVFQTGECLSNRRMSVALIPLLMTTIEIINTSINAIREETRGNTIVLCYQYLVLYF